MKIEQEFFGKKGESCSHQRSIQKPVKHLRLIKFLGEILDGGKSLTILVKSSILDVWKGSEYTSGHYTDSLL